MADLMKLYWIFVGLFVLSVLMFGFGVFTANTSVGVTGVILTFLLYLFRRSFLAGVQDHSDPTDKRGE